MKSSTASLIVSIWCLFILFKVEGQGRPDTVKLRNNYNTLKNLLSTDSANLDLLLDLAQTSRKLSNADEALLYLNQIKDLDSLHLEARSLEAYVLRDQGELQKSFDLWLRVGEEINQLPNAERIHYDLALLAMKLERYEVGISSLEKAIALDDTKANYFLNLGVCRARSKRLKEGCSDWKRAHELGATQAEALIRKYCPVTCKELFTNCED
ncbi:MAG: hypothetical protein R8G66_07790 [Cytophagales bacterium]|nr:hypothetical protein [Cytophagales bacterium]